MGILGIFCDHEPVYLAGASSIDTYKVSSFLYDNLAILFAVIHANRINLANVNDGDTTIRGYRKILSLSPLLMGTLGCLWFHLLSRVPLLIAQFWEEFDHKRSLTATSKIVPCQKYHGPLPRNYWSWQILEKEIPPSDEQLLSLSDINAHISGNMLTYYSLNIILYINIYLIWKLIGSNLVGIYRLIYQLY